MQRHRLLPLAEQLRKKSNWVHFVSLVLASLIIVTGVIVLVTILRLLMGAGGDFLLPACLLGFLMVICFVFGSNEVRLISKKISKDIGNNLDRPLLVLKLAFRHELNVGRVSSEMIAELEKVGDFLPDTYEVYVQEPNNR